MDESEQLTNEERNELLETVGDEAEGDELLELLATYQEDVSNDHDGQRDAAESNQVNPGTSNEAKSGDNVVNNHINNDGQVENSNAIDADGTVENDEDVSIVQEIPGKVVVKTGHELLELIRQLVMDSLSDSEQEKEAWIKKIVDKVEEIELFYQFTEKNLQYKESALFKTLTAAHIEELIDCKTDENKKYVLTTYFDELKDDLAKYRNKKQIKEQKLQELQQYKEAKKENPKTSVPASLSKRESAKKQNLIRRLIKEIGKLNRQLDRYEKRELTLDELDDEESSFIKEDSIKRKILNKTEKLRELEGKTPLKVKFLDKKFVYSGTDYPEVNSAVSIFVEQHLRKHDLKKDMPKYSCPDFNDIKTVIEGQSCVGNMKPEDLMVFCQKVFKEVGNSLRERRINDVKGIFINVELDEEQQAGFQLIEESDPELLAKLQENDKYKKKEEVVLEEFKKKAESMSKEELEKMMAEETGETSSETGEEDDEAEEVEASDISDSDDDGEEVIIEDDDEEGAEQKGQSETGDDDQADGENVIQGPSVSELSSQSFDSDSKGTNGVRKRNSDTVLLESEDDDDSAGSALKKVKTNHYGYESSPGSPEVVDLCSDSEDE